MSNNQSIEEMNARFFDKVILIGNTSKVVFEKYIEKRGTDTDLSIYSFNDSSLEEEKKLMGELISLVNKEFFSPKENQRYTVMLTVLGGKTTDELLETLSNFCPKQIFTSFFVIYTKPFGWEGHNRMELASASEEKIYELFPTRVGINYGSLNPAGSDNFFEFYDRLIFRILDELLSVIVV